MISSPLVGWRRSMISRNWPGNLTFAVRSIAPSLSVLLDQDAKAREPQSLLICRRRSYGGVGETGKAVGKALNYVGASISRRRGSNVYVRFQEKNPKLTADFYEFCVFVFLVVMCSQN